MTQVFVLVSKNHANQIQTVIRVYKKKPVKIPSENAWGFHDLVEVELKEREL